MEFTCGICENSRENAPFVAREMHLGSLDEFQYFQCASCGCLQIAVVPSDLGRYYPAGYYSFIDLDKNSLTQTIKNILLKKRNQYSLNGRGVLGRWVHNVRPADMIFSLLKGFSDPLDISILDVGCGSGTLAYQLKELGVKNVLGLDPYIQKEMVYRNGLKIIKGNLVQLAARQLKFDVILFNHSFEHMSDPVGQLTYASSILNANGTIMIATPTVSSYAWKHYGVNWVQMDPPRHLFLFSLKAIDILTTKTDLHVEKIIYNSTAFQFWGSEQYKKGVPLDSPTSYKHSKMRSMFSRGEIKEFRRRSKELNRTMQGDQAVFYIKKTAERKSRQAAS